MERNRNIRLLALHNFLVNFEPHMPIAVIYFVQVTGSFSLGMLIFSINKLSSAIFEVPTGVLSDFVGRKKTIVLGSVAGTLAIVFFALGGSFWILALGAIFEGLAYSFYSGNNEAFLHETLRQDGRTEEYAHMLGRTSSFFQAGLGTSALLGSAVAIFYPLSIVFWAGVLPRLLCIVVSLFMRKPTVHEKELHGNVFLHLKAALAKFKRNAKLRTLSIASILNFGVSESTYLFTPAFYALLWPVWALGLARVISNITAFIGFWFAGTFIRRFKALRSLIVSKVCGCGMALVAFVFPTALSPLLASCSSLFFGLQCTAESTLFQKEFTHRQRATMGSLNQFAGSIFFAVFAFGFGFIADTIGPTKSLIVGELLIFAIIGLYWRIFRHE